MSLLSNIIGGFTSNPKAATPVRKPAIPFIPGTAPAVFKPGTTPLGNYRVQDAQTAPTQQSVQRASNVFQWTPGFQDIVNKANPVVVGDIPSAMESALKSGGRAAAVYSPVLRGGAVPYSQYTNPQGIAIDKQYRDHAATITHEGLHAAYQNDVKTRVDFKKAYNQSNTPILRQYLAERLRGYKGAPTKPDDFKDINKLPFNMQTELHSYVAEAPQQYLQAPPGAKRLGAPVGNLPRQLDGYFSRYIKPNSVKAVQQFRSDIKNMVDDPKYYYSERTDN